MLTNQSMIYFAPEPWAGLWRNRQQLMSVFARTNKVLFVEERLHVRRVLTAGRRGRLDARVLRQPCLETVTENLSIFRYPVWAPLSGWMPLGKLTQRVRRTALLAALRKLQMTNPIIWYSRPGMVGLVPEVPPAALRIYHVVDEYTAYAGQSAETRRRTELLERAMFCQVDMVIVVSERLLQAKQPFHNHMHLVANAVDYDLYSQRLADPRLPCAVEAIPSPRLGYIGLIGDKLDFDLLRQVAEQNPAWSLVFLGEERVVRERSAWQALTQLPNVHKLGAVAADQVPDYVKGFAVGLMPYVRDRHAEHISPLKLYEYLAAGIPVVSADIPAAREFACEVHIACDAMEFIGAIRQALGECQPEHRQLRRSLAAQHTWEHRARQISDLIRQQLEHSQQCEIR